jgi:hypothetical protein
MKKIDAKDVKGIATSESDNLLKEVITRTEHFINKKIPIFNTKTDNTYIVKFHGSVCFWTFTIPKDTIVILLSPTNRVSIQGDDFLKSILELITTPNQFEEYIKKPGCLPKTNYCFKYASIFYPGQKCFDLRLTPFETDESSYKYEGITRVDTIDLKKPNFNFKLNRDTLKFPLYLSAIVSSKKNGIFIVSTCRPCGLYLDNFLTEALYYNEFMLNFINRHSKSNCSQIDEDVKCKDAFTKVYNQNINQNEFPLLVELSPIQNANNKFTFHIKDIKIILNNDNTINFEKLFNELDKVDINKLLKIEISIFDNIIFFKFDTTNFNRWNTYLKDRLFKDGNLILTDISSAVNAIHNYPYKNYNSILKYSYSFNKLLISYIFWYYLTETDLYLKKQLEKLFYNDSISSLNGIIIYVNEKELVPFSVKGNEYRMDMYSDMLILLNLNIYDYRKNYYNEYSKSFIELYLLSEKNDNIEAIFEELQINSNKNFENFLEKLVLNIEEYKININMMAYKIFSDNYSYWKSLYDNLYLKDSILISNGLQSLLNYYKDNDFLICFVYKLLDGTYKPEIITKDQFQKSLNSLPDN